MSVGLSFWFSLSLLYAELLFYIGGFLFQNLVPSTFVIHLFTLYNSICEPSYHGLQESVKFCDFLFAYAELVILG